MKITRNILKKLLKERGYTFSDIAAMADCNHSFITNLATGRRKSRRILGIIRLVLDNDSITIKSNQ
jgi:transcriptional regulator with XRE-family HTH domain